MGDVTLGLPYCMYEVNGGWLKKPKILLMLAGIMADAHPLIRAEISGHSKHSLTSQRLIIGPSVSRQPLLFSLVLQKQHPVLSV